MTLQFFLALVGFASLIGALHFLWEIMAGRDKPYNIGNFLFLICTSFALMYLAVSM